MQHINYITDNDCSNEDIADYLSYWNNKQIKYEKSFSNYIDKTTLKYEKLNKKTKVITHKKEAD